MKTKPVYASKTFFNLPDAPASQRLLSKIASAPDPIALPRTIDRPLALYGAGDLGRMAKDYLDRLGIPISFVVDKNADSARDHPVWAGIPVLKPEEVKSSDKTRMLLAICVVTAPYVPIHESLINTGWTDVVPFYDVAEAYRDKLPLSNGWFLPPLSQDDVEQTEMVLSRWDDDLSRAHHLQFIAWRRLRHEWIFEGASVSNDNRYFIPEIKSALGKSESFADLGAHVGLTTLRFMKETNNQFENIWCIEADPHNRDVLIETLSRHTSDNSNKIEIKAVTLGQKRGESTFFDGFGYASQTSDLGQKVHTIETLDHLKISPTFIKLHLEGAEMSVLQGATNTLSRMRPIVTATSYHNELGVWKLPAWMMNNLMNYRFYFRIHSWCGTGAVVYAIPQKDSVGT